MSWRSINWCQYPKNQQDNLKKNIIKIYKNCTNINFFNPFLLEFSIYNNTYKRLNHRFIITDLYYLVNTININIRVFKSRVKDVKKKRFKKTLLVTKELPILPLNDYLCLKNNEIGELNQYQFNVYSQSLSYNNPTITEIIVNYLTSNLYENKYTPHFVLCYGNINLRIPKFTFDYDDYSTINLKQDYIKYFPNTNNIQVENYPITILTNEYIPLRLIDYIKNIDYDIDLWSSIIFQIACAINIIWEKYNICHNDLHIYNINYILTKKKFIYYENPFQPNTYFKVPTFGIILKIIDWGRACFKWNGNWIQNNVFGPEGEAFGQFYFTRNYKSNKKKNHPRSGQDILFFIYSLISETNNICKDKLMEKLILITKDKKLLSKRKIDFNLYKDISFRKKIQTNKDIICSNFFSKYLINNKISKNKMIYKIK